MKKLYLLLLTLFIAFNGINASQRNIQEAVQIAGSFFNSSKQSSNIQKAPGSNNVIQLMYSKTSEQNPEENLYYVFGKNESQGYVIVSGDDRAHKILGYSDVDTFDPENIPENMKNWLNFYEAEIKLLKNNKVANEISVPTQNSVQSNNTFTNAVAPLLGGIKWNQGEPYNNLCPTVTSTNKKTVTGCVATAMAQVMMFHKWPITATGNNSYTSNTNKFSLSADFSKVSFDWNNMTDAYGSTSTATQKDAVASLMYNCGIAVNMDYAESSGASPKAMARAMKTNFGYDQNLQYYSRNYYTREEWIQLLKTEIDENRPVLYDGYSTDGGHEFVCDGYDSNGLFHFNWGWGGSSNGYFQISALDPSEQGIGGSSGGYNGGQGILVGLQKPKTGTKTVSQIQMNDTISFSTDSLFRTTPFSLTANKIFNYGANIFVGNLAIGLYDSNNSFVAILQNYNISELKDGYGWNVLSFSTISLPNSIKAGNYQLHVIYKLTNDIEWMKVRSLVGTPSSINLRVTNTFIYFETPREAKPQLELKSLKVKGNLYKGKTGRFTVELTNTGEEYNSEIGIYLQLASDNSIFKFIKTEKVNLLKGETRELIFNGIINLEPGQYNLAVMYDKKNNPGKVEQLSAFENIQTVNIMTAPTGEPSFTLKSKISFPNATQVNKAYDILTAELNNSGGYYDKKMIAFIFPMSGGSSLTYIGYQDVIMDQNENQNVQFKGGINLEPGKYQIALYYQNSENAWTRVSPSANSSIVFTLVNDYTGLNAALEKTGLSIYPVPVKERLNIKSESKIISISIYNIGGQLLLQTKGAYSNESKIDVSKFDAGSYILRAQTENGVITDRFIKQ